MEVFFSIQIGDVTTFQADVLALKFAQGFYGADRVVAGILDKDVSAMRDLLPKLGSHKLLPASNMLTATSVLFVSVPYLNDFRYEEIRKFATNVLKAVAQDAPLTRHLAMTIHGVGYGLDETEALRAQLAGCLDALEQGQFPPHLKRISIVERNPDRAQRLTDVLSSAIPECIVQVSTDHTAIERSSSVTNVGRESTSKPHILVMMPSDEEMGDFYYFGVKYPANKAGYLCEKVNLSSNSTVSVLANEIAGESYGSTSAYLTDIHRLIVKRFNVEELRMLCFDLSVDYDNLRGGGKADRARELLLYLSRRARVLELVNFVRIRRPNMAWPDTLQSSTSEYLLLERVKLRIDTASFVIADLTSLDPNTLLLVGYAWGKDCPTILLAKEGTNLPFDVRGQRCLVYSRILDLNEMLAQELLNTGDKTTIV